VGDIIIEEINYKAVAQVIGSFLLLAASIAITVFGFKHHRISYWTSGIIASFFLLILFIVNVANSMKIRKLLTITYEGIIDSSSRGGIGFISFDEIKDFTIVSLYNKKAIAVILKDVNGFLSKLSVVKRRLVRRNMNQDLPAVFIQVDLAKDIEPEDILSMLKKRLADYSSLYE
jgi:hypothetical protein